MKHIKPALRKRFNYHRIMCPTGSHPGDQWDTKQKTFIHEISKADTSLNVTNTLNEHAFLDQMFGNQQAQTKWPQMYKNFSEKFA